MIQIEKIKIVPPKWKWWQIVFSVIAVIIALKVDSADAFGLLSELLEWLTSQ